MNAGILTQGLLFANLTFLAMVRGIRTGGSAIFYNIIRLSPAFATLVLAGPANPYRFAGRKQVVRPARLDPNASRSGKISRKRVPVISKNGNADLRYTLWQTEFGFTLHNVTANISTGRKSKS